MAIESPVSLIGTINPSLISISNPSSDRDPNNVPMIRLFKTCCEMISKIVNIAGAWIFILAGPLADPAAGAITFGLTKCINEFVCDMMMMMLIIVVVN